MNELEKKIAKEIDFLSDHWVNGDDKPPFSFGGWREEVIASIVNIFEQSYAEREKALVEKFEEIIGEDEEITPYWRESCEGARNGLKRKQREALAIKFNISFSHCKTVCARRQWKEIV